MTKTQVEEFLVKLENQLLNNSEQGIVITEDTIFRGTGDQMREIFWR
jgi:hypothetical protein